ncbi:glycerophosphodiester phosphodiesterase [Microbacterium mitrae]|uniref:Glycerophosphodiester phosphodiesterase n=1 Tax=Microbacterium mitrae TaxID=664640 RepID=A0A5C8HUD7_9MICO|nr:glycerophosphodiester phosphodiesterase family protein [Microbacterium mitrae]TXK06651.1 glycerophosphodiester phosphodiesterase [Microbacterium mitrae]
MTHPYLAGTAPQLLAHRGLVNSDEATAGVVENSFAAIAAAHAAGAQYIESDCHLTSDGVVVLFHDSSLLRVTGDERLVADVSTVELEHLMLERGGLITLEQALVSFPETRFNIDIKAEAAAVPVADIVAKHADRVLLTSFSDRARRRAAARLKHLDALPAYSPGKATMALIVLAVALRIGPWQKRLLRGFDALQIPESFGPVRVLTPRLVAAAHRFATLVHVWTINEPDEMRRLLAMGVDGLVTDRIDVALAL